MKKKFLGILFSVIMVLCINVNIGEKAFAAGVSSINHTVLVKGELGSDAAGKSVTLLLLKQETDVGSIRSGDIGYIAQLKTDSQGSYRFSFKFNDFEFDENGNVSNYKLMMNQAGKNVTDSITEAKTLSEHLNLKLDITADNGSAEIKSYLDNIYGLETTFDLITAFYDINGKLINIVLDQKQVEKNTVCQTSSVRFQAENVYRIKAYAWESTESMIPLCSAAERSVNEFFSNGGFETDNGLYTDWATGKNMKCIVRSSEEAFMGSHSIYFSNTSISSGAVLDKGAGVYSKNILPLVRGNGIGTYKVSAMVKSEAADAKLRAVLVTRKADGEFVYTTLTEESGMQYIDISPDECREYSATINVSDTADLSSMVLMFESPGKYSGTSYPAQKIFLDCISMAPVTVDSEDLPDRTNIYLVGDSICTNYVENEQNQQGWGYYFDDAFNSDAAKVFNCARGGWSTESFLRGQALKTSFPGITECELWSGISSGLKTGDFVIISLGHNDSSQTNFRATSEEKYKENLTKMIADVREKQATPILIASIPVVWDELWEDSTNPNSTMISKDQQPVSIYGGYMRVVAQTTNTIFLDVNAVMYNKCNELGMAAVRDAYYISDNVHLNDTGAQYVNQIILDMIKNEPSLSELTQLMIQK